MALTGFALRSSSLSQESDLSRFQVLGRWPALLGRRPSPTAPSLMPTFPMRSRRRGVPRIRGDDSASESIDRYLTLAGALMACKNHVGPLRLHWEDSNGKRGGCC